MLELLKGKKVFVLISTRSGVSTAVGNMGSENAINGVCKVTGTFIDCDDKFILIEEATNTYMNAFDEYSLKNHIAPYSLNSKRTFVKIDNIIFISEV